MFSSRGRRTVKIVRLSALFASFLLLALLGACSATKFTSLWKDENYKGRPERIMVIGALENPASRRLFEEELVKELKDRAVDAVASYAVLTDQSVSDRNAAAVQAKELGADTVIISKQVGKRKVAAEERIPEPFQAFQIVPVAYDEVYINIQTDVYDLKTNSVILTATSETWIREGVAYLTHVQPFVKSLVKKLSQQGLFH